MSVASHAPKGKTYFTTESLRARIGIAGAVQVAGYRDMWGTIFLEFPLNVDNNLCGVLTTMNKRKGEKRSISSTKEGKWKKLLQNTLNSNRRKMVI